MNGNDLEDLDDMLDGLGGPKSKSSMISKRVVPAPHVEEDIDDLWGGSNKASVIPASQKSRIPSAQAAPLNLDNSMGRTANAFKPSGKQDKKDGLSEVENFLCEAYNLILRDQFLGFPVTMANIFNNKVSKSLDTREFLNSNDLDTLRLKNEIFYSAKLAFHMAIDKYSMYDLEVPSGQQLLDEIKAEDGQWFLGGENYMWNSAIERGYPQLERLIMKKDQYFVHKLKYGQTKESKFSLF